MRVSAAIAPFGMALTAAGFSESMTFAFIERQAALPVLRSRRGAGRDRQSAVGEVRRAAAVAAAGPDRFVRAQPAARPQGRPAVRDRQPVHARRGRTRRRRSPGAAQRRRALVGAGASGGLLRRQGRRRAAVRRARAADGIARLPRRRAVRTWSRAAPPTSAAADAYIGSRRPARAGDRGSARFSRG